MARKADVKGGNGDVIFDLENGIARKYLRNTSSVDKVQRFEKELKLLKQISTLKICSSTKCLYKFGENTRFLY